MGKGSESGITKRRTGPENVFYSVFQSNPPFSDTHLNLVSMTFLIIVIIAWKLLHVI